MEHIETFKRLWAVAQAMKAEMPDEFERSLCEEIEARMEVLSEDPTEVMLGALPDLAHLFISLGQPEQVFAVNKLKLQVLLQHIEKMGEYADAIDLIENYILLGSDLADDWRHTDDHMRYIDAELAALPKLAEPSTSTPSSPSQAPSSTQQQVAETPSRPDHARYGWMLAKAMLAVQRMYSCSEMDEEEDMQKSLHQAEQCFMDLLQACSCQQPSPLLHSFTVRAYWSLWELYVFVLNGERALWALSHIAPFFEGDPEHWKDELYDAYRETYRIMGNAEKMAEYQALYDHAIEEQERIEREEEEADANRPNVDLEDLPF